MRWLPRALAAGAVLAAALAPTMAPAQQADRPGLWSGQAVARGLSIALNADPRALPVDDLVRLDMPEGETSWTGTSADARASVLYPGTSGTGGPMLLCEFGFPCPDGFPPRYPLTAHAQWPTQPEAQTPAGAARAHAGAAVVASVAELTDAAGDVLAPLAPALAVGAATAVTEQRFEGDDLVARARSRVEQLRLLDGLVVISSVEAAARSVTAATGSGRSHSTLRLAGVTVAGRPAAVDADGIDVLPGPGREQAERLLEAALDRWDARIRLLGASHDSGGTTTSGRATGLLVDLRVPVTGPSAPVAGTAYRAYLVTLVVADAGTRAYAAGPGPDLTSTAGAGSEPSPAGGGPAGAPAQTGPAPAAGHGTASPTAAGAVAPQTSGASASPSGHRAPLLGLLGGLVADRVALAYSVATLLGAGAFVGSRLLTRRTAVAA